jgi:Tfp pilus assembly pilus retraction ATPase PilT
MTQILDRVLTAIRQLGASDVHLKAGGSPVFRIRGRLRTVRAVPAQDGSAGMVLRVIPPVVPPFDPLNRPQTVLDLTTNACGIRL